MLTLILFLGCFGAEPIQIYLTKLPSIDIFYPHYYAVEIQRDVTFQYIGNIYCNFTWVATNFEIADPDYAPRPDELDEYEGNYILCCEISKEPIQETKWHCYYLDGNQKLYFYGLRKTLKFLINKKKRVNYDCEDIEIVNYDEIFKSVDECFYYYSVGE